jgi:hypothetical protein
MADIKERAQRELNKAKEMGYEAYFEGLQSRKAKLYWWVIPIIAVASFGLGYIVGQ